MSSVLIVGASSAIAQAIARIYAEKEYEILLAGRLSESVDVFQKDLSIRYKVNVDQFFFDATDTSSYQTLLNRLDPCPDIVICAVGYLGDQSLAQADWKESNKIMVTNFTGLLPLLSAIAEVMEQRKSGTIVGISSVAGDRGRMSNYFYGSAKAGFTTYLSGLRNRLAVSNVHVVTVKPGFVDTRMTEHLSLSPLLTAQPETVAQHIFRAVQKKQNVIYTLPRWRLIMLVIVLIPERIFKKLKL